MAYIEQRKNGWLVVWRDAETGKKQSELCGFFDPDDDEDRARTRERAEALRTRMASTERATRRVLERRDAAIARIDPRAALATDMVNPDEEDLRFENYVGGLIDNGDLTESAKHTYRHTLKNHIAGTPLGRKNIRFIDETDVEPFWRAVVCGDGAKRNIAQVLRKGFTRAVKRGLIDVSPMSRADISVPSKKRRVRGLIVPLEVEDLRKLSASASTERNRLIVLTMGFGGLRAGEVGGLTRRDILRAERLLRVEPAPAGRSGRTREAHHRAED